MLVVAAHFWRNTGNVVAPTGENLAYNRIHTLIHSATNGWIPAARTVSPASPGSVAAFGGNPGPFPPRFVPAQDGCCVRKDAPARRKLHLHHSRSKRNPRVPRSKDDPHGSSLAALPTTDRV